MRNSLKTANQASDQQQQTDEGGKWTVVQEGRTLVPLPPTISANGEAANRKDELMISQWNVPEPIISEKEKQLLEQLKGRLKSRDDNKNEKKKEEVRSNKNDDRDKQLRDRSPSKGKYRRDKRSRSRSPISRRDRRSRSRSPISHRDRRSRSPRRDSKRRSRSRSRGRRIEKPVVRHPEFKPRVSGSDNHREKDRDHDQKKYKKRRNK